MNAILSAVEHLRSQAKLTRELVLNGKLRSGTHDSFEASVYAATAFRFIDDHAKDYSDMRFEYGDGKLTATVLGLSKAYHNIGPNILQGMLTRAVLPKLDNGDEPNIRCVTGGALWPILWPQQMANGLQLST